LLTEPEWAEAREHLAQALRAGWVVLVRDGSSVDAVEAAVVVLEDSPHFNAGHGAALNTDGAHELDASIMDGQSLAGGGVCAARQIRNPIRAARAVMDAGEAVLVAGAAADAFAAARGLAMVANDYFTTQRRLAALARVKGRAERGTFAPASEADKHGTVGAVALDRRGNLAAATSTGGFNNKPSGRVGDSPVLGAGTYARNGVCAVSGTGQGEIFLRHVAAFDLVARMLYGGQSLEAASTALVFETLAAHRLGVGLIACDAGGRIVAPYNTLGMYRGWIAIAPGDAVGSRGAREAGAAVTGTPRVIVATHSAWHDLGPADAACSA
jgi:beta-aspartyl-peptidase (threonine type)